MHSKSFSWRYRTQRKTVYVQGFSENSSRNQSTLSSPACSAFELVSIQSWEQINFSFPRKAMLYCKAQFFISPRFLVTVYFFIQRDEIGDLLKGTINKKLFYIWFLFFFVRVVQLSNKNLMTVDNVVIIFGPIIVSCVCYCF